MHFYLLPLCSVALARRSLHSWSRRLTNWNLTGKSLKLFSSRPIAPKKIWKTTFQPCLGMPSDLEIQLLKNWANTLMLMVWSRSECSLAFIQCLLIGIPTLIIFDCEKNKVISTNGRGRVSGDPNGEVCCNYIYIILQLHIYSVFTSLIISHFHNNYCLYVDVVTRPVCLGIPLAQETSCSTETREHERREWLPSPDLVYW